MYITINENSIFEEFDNHSVFSNIVSFSSDNRFNVDFIVAYDESFDMPTSFEEYSTIEICLIDNVLTAILK